MTYRKTTAPNEEWSAWRSR